MQNGIVNGRVSYTFLGLELIVTDSLEAGDAIGKFHVCSEILKLAMQ